MASGARKKSDSGLHVRSTRPTAARTSEHVALAAAHNGVSAAARSMRHFGAPPLAAHVRLVFGRQAAAEHDEDEGESCDEADDKESDGGHATLGRQETALTSAYEFPPSRISLLPFLRSFPSSALPSLICLFSIFFLLFYFSPEFLFAPLLSLYFHPIPSLPSLKDDAPSFRDISTFACMSGSCKRSCREDLKKNENFCW